MHVVFQFEGTNVDFMYTLCDKFLLNKILQLFEWSVTDLHKSQATLNELKQLMLLRIFCF